MTPHAGIIQEIKEHAAREFPRESCGLVVVRKGRQRYFACRNIAEGTQHFVIDTVDQILAEDAGEIICVVHSHPNLPPVPSQADLEGCERSGVPWLIVNWPVGTMYEFAPSGYVAPLYGREFSHGVHDCYSFIRDYYARELSIDLPDFQRPDKWWEKGMNLYLEGFESAGFVKVASPPQPNDGLLMRVGAPVANHGAIYLGENLIAHHQQGRLSSRDVYGGWYERITTHVLRHRSFFK